MRFSASFVLACGLAALGCSSSSGSPPGDAGPTTDGGSSQAADLSGTWDVVGSRPGQTPASGTIAINKAQLTITMSDFELSYAASGDTLTVTYREGSSTRTIATTRTPATLASKIGILPVDITGGYTFTSSTDPTDSCSFDGELGTFTGKCTKGGGREPVDRAHAGNVYTAARTQALASRFGDLGGVWRGTADGADPSGGCVFTIQGSTIRSECGPESAWLEGTADLTFVDTTSASGKTSSGVEYSGKRR